MLFYKDKKLLSFFEIGKLKKNRRKEDFLRNLIRFTCAHPDVKSIINLNLNMIIMTSLFYFARNVNCYYVAFIVCKLFNSRCLCGQLNVKSWIFLYCLYFLLSIFTFSLFNAQMCVCLSCFK